MTDAAQEIDVSPNGLKRFCIRNGIQMPPVGYWQRRASGYSHEQSLVSQKPVRGPRKLVSGEMLDTVRQLMREGLSLRKAAKSVGCCHTTLLTRLVGDPVLLLSKHGNAKHMKMAARAGIEPANEISS